MIVKIMSWLQGEKSDRSDIYSVNNCIEKLRALPHVSEEDPRIVYEMERLKNLSVECLEFVTEHNNNVGNHAAQERFNKNIKDCNVFELMCLGFSPDYISQEHAEEEERKTKEAMRGEVRYED